MKEVHHTLARSFSWIAALGVTLCLGACDDDAVLVSDAGTDVAIMEDSSAPLDGAPLDGSADLGTMDGAAGGESLRAPEYLDTFFASLCAWFIRCEPKIGAVAFGEILCHPSRSGELQSDFLALLESGQARFDAERGQRCLDEIGAAECNVAYIDTLRCDAAFIGRVETGGACQTDLQCGQGRCVVSDMCPGECTVVLASENCERREDCAAGLTCTAGVCAAPREAGETCRTRTDCIYPLTCQAGQCGPPASEGDHCSAGLAGDSCGADWVCVSERCTEGSVPGESCDGAHRCAPGGRCVEGNCVATASLGQPCEINGCIALTVCIAGQCEAMGVAGDGCSDEQPCVQGACVANTCTLRADGEACDSEVQFGECEGLCSRGRCVPRSVEGQACRGSSQCEEGFDCRESGGPPTCQPSCDGR